MAIVSLARDIFKAFASILLFVGAFWTATWLLLLVVGLVIAALSGQSVSWSDARDDFLYLGAGLAFVAAFAAIAAPFDALSDRRKARDLATLPLAEPIAIWPTHDALYVLERTRPRVCRVTGNDVTEVPFELRGGRLTAPRAITLTGDGAIFVANPLSGEVLVLRPDEDRVTCLPLAVVGGVATGAMVPVALAVDADGNVIVADASGGRLFRARPDGGADVITDGIRGVRGMASARDGAVYVSDKFDNRVLRVTRAGEIQSVAGTGESGFDGDGGPATDARLAQPTGLAIWRTAVCMSQIPATTECVSSTRPVES